jgi:uncharacterized protein
VTEPNVSGRDHRSDRPLDTAGDPLTFALAGLLGEAPGAVRSFDIEGVAVQPEDTARVSRPLQGTVRLLRTNRGLVLETDLRTALDGECARCLRSLETPVRLRIREEVRPSIDFGSGQEVPEEEDEDPEATRLNDHHELELRPLVHEAISLAEPIAPVCEPDCPGLCPECGQRMEPGHEHDDAPIDPRLEALRGFRVDAADETE